MNKSPKRKRADFRLKEHEMEIMKGEFELNDNGKGNEMKRMVIEVSKL